MVAREDEKVVEAITATQLHTNTRTHTLNMRMNAVAKMKRKAEISQCVQDAWKIGMDVPCIDNIKMV